MRIYFAGFRKPWSVPVFSVFSVFIFALLLFMSGMARATNYVFPGTLPAGCSGSGPSYTCGSLALGWQDTITINSPKPATITISGNLSTNENSINTAGSAGDLTLNVTGTVTTSGLTRIVGNLGAGSTISLGNQTQVTGNVSGSGGLSTNSSVVITGTVNVTGATTLGWQTRITGTTTAASVNCSSGECTFGNTVTANSGDALIGGTSTVAGNVVASAGNVNIGSSATVTGNVTARGTLTTGSSSRITGNASIGGAATLGWRTRITGTTTAASVNCSSGECTFGNAVTASSGDALIGGTSTVAGNVVASAGNVNIGSSATVTGNVTAGGTLTTGSSSRITGNATITGTATFGWASRVDGTTGAASVSCSSGECVFGGTITANTGNAALGYQSSVTGNVLTPSSSGIIALSSSVRVSGCAMTSRTGSGSITLGWGAAVSGGVCCNSGGSCLPTSNACYTNGSGSTISNGTCALLASPAQVKVGSCTVSGVTTSFTTVQAAVNAVADGGTVWICSGTYPETVSISNKALTVQSVTGVTSDVNIVSSTAYSAALTTTRALTVNNLTLTSSTSGTHGISSCPATATTLSVSGLQFNITGSTGAGVYQGGSCAGLQLTATNISNSTSATSGIDIRNGTGNHVINNAVLHGSNGWGWPVRITGGANITLTDVDAYQQGTSASYYPAINLSGFTGDVTIAPATKTGNRCTDINGNANAYPGVCISNRDTATGTAQTNRNSYGVSICSAVGSTSRINISNAYASGSMAGISIAGGSGCGNHTANFSNVTTEVNSAYFSLTGSATDISSGHGWAYPISISNGTGTHTLTNVTANGTYAFNGIAINGGGATLTDVTATGVQWAISISATGPVTITNPTWAAANPYPATNPANFPIRGVAWNQIYGSGLSISLSTTSATTLTTQNTAIGAAGTGMWVNYNAYSYPNAKLVMSNVTVDAARSDGVVLFYGTGQAHAISNVTVKAARTAMKLERGTSATLSNLNLTCGNDGATAGTGLLLDTQAGAVVSGTNTITCKSPSSKGISVGGPNGGCTNCSVSGATVDMQSQSGSSGIYAYNGDGTSRTISGNTIRNAPAYGIYVYDYPDTVTNNLIENSGGSNYGLYMGRGQGIAYNNCVYSPTGHVISSATSLCAGASPCSSTYPLIDPKPSPTATKQGNFWGSWPKGTGFSDTCTDANGDGICDSATGGDNAPLRRCGASALADWRMDEASWNGTAGEIKDATSSAYHGTATGATTAAGKICQAADLSATGIGDYLKFPHNALHGLDSFSIALWFKTATNKAQQELLHGLGSSASDDQIEIYLKDSNQVVVNVRDSSNVTFTAPGTLTNNTWHHLAFTRSGTSGCLYIDGALVTCQASYTTGTLSITANALLSGQEQDSFGGTFNSGQALEGYIDELKIWGSALTAAQIATGYANENAGNDWDGGTRTCPGGLDHYEISAPSTGIACASVTVTVTACAKPATTAPCTDKYTAASGKTVKLTTDAGALSAATLTLDSTGVASATLGYPAATNGASATVTLSNEQLPGTYPRRCCPDGANCVTRDTCSVTFSTAGLLISDSATGGAVTPVTQTSGTTSGTYYLRAVKSSTTTAACQSAISGNRQVPMAYTCVDPATCSSGNWMTVAGTSFGSAGGSPTLSFDPLTGAAPFTFLYNDAGKISLTAGPLTADNGASLAATTTGSFVVKPAALCVYSTDLSTCAAADATCSKVKKAGETFNQTVTAVRSGYDCASASTYATPNYQATGITLGSETIAPAGGAGGVGVTSVDIVSGGSAAASQSASEVGVFKFTATPPSYFGESIGSPPFKTGSIGRFYPDHFHVDFNTPKFQPGCGTAFTYLGQTFSYSTAPVMTVTAKNTAGVKTANYKGDFWKITNSSLTGKAYTALSGTLNTGGLPATDPVIASNNDGTGTLTFGSGTGLLFTRPTAPAVPFDAEISLAINVLDSDAVPYKTLDTGVYVDRNPARFSAATAGNGMAFNTGKAQRFGRLVISNAHGSELLPLSMPIQSQYWTSSSTWATNTDDSCTNPSASLVFVKTPTTLPTTPSGGALTSGKGQISFTKPDVKGSVDACANIGTDSDHAVTTCRNGTASSWLQGSWDADGNYNDNPAARATFGIYNRQGPVIYRREQH